ncbi:MAG: DNA polymerase III subunit chi [Pseudomonas sp.]|jgi:DNA polymerase-3 subunit chi|uniref:DNA polymerase III subunit chi n=1 Tax=Halopseudomonas TaxID=2901189 RepID=UPI001B723009|nr:DNA polymerase III subunit chi [Pseudomonas sp.]MBQ0776800.1 DNA polymerase III subunit chi [Pseudomonas sp.]WOD10716.1 DNA polymerase III subunit chi [Pseudomonas sp. NyZ704]
MTRIDFYLLTSSEPQKRLEYACRLAHKAWHKGHQIYLHCTDEEQTQALDELLWSFRADAFLPHARTTEQPEAKVVCGCGDDAGDHHDLLINLADESPTFFSQFNRLAEIVIELDPVRVPARERFRFYRERGYPLQTHQLRTAG